MSPELDKKLCEKYPKIFRDRNASMMVTCMCWGFPGNGWYDILDVLCYGIQKYIDNSRQSRNWALRRSRMIDKLVKNGTIEEYIRGYYKNYQSPEREKCIEAALANPNELKWKNIPEVICQVVADQVKEKFGGLCFYYHGGDEWVAGRVAMAEGMSYRVCEDCGLPGKRRSGGWIRVLCDKCEAEKETRK